MLKYAFGESGSVGRAEKPNAKAAAISMPLARYPRANVSASCFRP
jgi:hypothetical protein